MYQILCDGFVLYDTRDDSLIVSNPKCKLEVNTVGEASFSIYSNHPYYSMLQKLRSVFEIKQDNDVIFRGRMTDDSKDFYNMKTVDIEGAMAYFNDSVIRPFSFPEDFLEDADYNASENKVEFFLNWLITQHNSQVQDFQRFKLGDVTVADVNNYIIRSNESYANTWETLKSKLFDSELGGYLCIRYEEDGNYIDYLSDFEYTNIQKIKYGENLLDIKNDSDASETYSAILPLGAKITLVTDSTEEGTEEEEEEGTEEVEEATQTTQAIETRLTLETLEDGDIVDDIVKTGDILYSKSAVDAYGFILAPTSATTWDDVTEVSNLKTKAIEYLKGDAIKLKNTVELKAVDLNFTDEEIAAFRIYRYVEVDSAPHEHQDRYKLTKLEIDLLNPQNTQIQLGETRYSLHDSNYNKFQNANTKIENAKNELKNYVGSLKNAEIDSLKQTIVEQTTELTNTCEEIILSAMSSYVEINKGVTVSGITKYYLATSSDSNISIDEGEWMTNIPTLTQENCYLWCYELIAHSDARITNTQPYILATYNGTEIQSITEYYGANGNKENPTIETIIINEDETEETIISDLEWSTEIPSMSINNMYLWNYSVITYTDETTSETEKRMIDEYSYSYSELTEIVKSQLQILSDNITFNISELTKQVSTINGDLNSKLNEIKQYFTFDINGMTIGQSDSPCKVKIDEDSIELSLNEVPLLWMDVVTGETHTEKLTVTQELNLFGYKISEDDSGNVNLEYIG